MRRRALLGLSLALQCLVGTRHGVAGEDWAAVLERARGATVWFNAWAGDERTNAFIAWADGRLRELHGIELRHVKLVDTAEAVARVVAEVAAGRRSGGSIDLVWINGPNLLAMRERGLLYGPFVERLPGWHRVDRTRKRSNLVDFTVPVDGMACPWRLAQVVFVHDMARVPDPPRSAQALLRWAEAHPGRFAHPVVSDFLGATFLKQALVDLLDDRSPLARPVETVDYAALSDPLWRWYAELRPHLWRRGEQFPASGPAVRQLMNDGEVDLMISFDPQEATASIAQGLLPPTVRAYVWDRGTIGNTSFVAIPVNAAHPEAAMVVADFLISPEAQARAEDPRFLGALSVLDVEALPAPERALFDALPRDPATPSRAALGSPVDEPHPSWMSRIITEWERRYAA